MGIVNLDEMVLDSGIKLSNCYLSFSSGPMEFPFQPSPLKFSWSVSPDGVKSFAASGKLFVFASKESKDAGFAPLQTKEVSIPADVSADGVFSLFYTTLASKFANTSPDDGADRDNVARSISN